MKANELRVGNLVNRENMGHSFYITAEHLFHWDKFEKYLFPLQLTEEWLVKLGFDKFEYCYQTTFYHTEMDDLGVRETVCFHIYERGVDYYFTGKDSHGTNFVTSLQIKYVHQLQNLYFVLTGEELCVKE